MSFNKLELETNKNHLLLRKWGGCISLSLNADKLTHCSFVSDGLQVVVMLLWVQQGVGQAVVSCQGRRREEEGETQSSPGSA